MIKEIFQTLQDRMPLTPLLPTQIWRPEISRQISQASDRELFGTKSSSDTQDEMRLACRAGLLLLNDDLAASHNLSQQIQTPTGSFWHAIMHRREGDFSNANYWWRRTGTHPAFDDVYTEAMGVLLGAGDPTVRSFSGHLEAAGIWQPMKFVALCEKTAAENQESRWLQLLQQAEMTVLLSWCRERTG